MDPIKVDFTKKGKSGVKDILIPPEKAGLKILINIVITLIVAAVLYYFMMPPMNLKSTDFYMYFALVFAAYVGSAILTTKVLARPEYIPYVKRQATVPVILLVVLGLVLAGGYVSSALIFRAKSYSQILEVDENADFATSVSAIEKLSDFEKVPFIDKDAAIKLADKTVGELAALGLESQFNVANTYSTQINYQGKPYRVFPLEYGDVFKWLNQRQSGQPGYITVNMHTSEAELVTANADGEAVAVKYSPSEHFGRYLMRVLRFKYPTYMFGVPSFEIDDGGNPFWIVERIDKTVGLLGGEDVIGIVMVSAVTGECTYYDIEEVKSGTAADGSSLEWIDQVFDATLLIEQYDYRGRYSNGFINSIIGQEGVKMTTSGHSYLAINDDVYMYTGVTSVSVDESIIGFILINQRTKEASFYSETGATEKAAQDSAKGIVQDKGWSATFPLLLNIDGVPTYFMALKDSSAVVKSYAMVNVNQYSDAVRSPSDDNPDIVECLKAYIAKVSTRLTINVDMGAGDGNETPDETDDIYVTGVIAEIRPAVIGGNSVYYVRLQDSGVFFMINAAQNKEVVILNVGDTISLVVKTDEGSIIDANIGGPAEDDSEPEDAAGGENAEDPTENATE